MSNPGPDFDPATAVTVGRISAAHGVHGDVKVQTLTDFPERFDPGAVLWLEGREVRVEQSRWQGRLVYLKLEGIDDRNAAEAVQGLELQVPRPHELTAEGVFYQHDIIGLRVVDNEGVELGRVASILPTGSNDVYVVRGERGELLLPAIDDVIKRIDVAGGVIHIELLPGLEFLKRSK